MRVLRAPRFQTYLAWQSAPLLPLPLQMRPSTAISHSLPMKKDSLISIFFPHFFCFSFFKFQL